MIHPQHLAVFAAIVRAGGVTRAAARLGCDKSVVSRQLTRLEAELGSPLFLRSARSMALTETGCLILKEARRIDRSIARIEQLGRRNDLAGWRRGRRG
jgi:DNA-binding transcriptional LysR family regulator